MEAESWKILFDNNLEKYISILEENNIDMEILSELTDTDYIKLGITGSDMQKMKQLFMKEIIEVPVTIEDSPVHKILRENQLDEYIPIFDKHKLNTFDIISKLNENDLTELGITVIGDRKKIKSLFIEGSATTQDSGSNVNVNQTVNVGGESHTGVKVAGGALAGGILGALAVIVFIMIMISNETANL
ncbi:MAG: hypothetical protein LBM77_12865 [Spirochaetaceae bacterium]|jgi:hypothetical protein|nr:hypothetical protein [Spirochaetaceae bacterium]